MIESGIRTRTEVDVCVAMARKTFSGERVHHDEIKSISLMACRGCAASVSSERSRLRTTAVIDNSDVTLTLELSAQSFDVTLHLFPLKIAPLDHGGLNGIPHSWHSRAD